MPFSAILALVLKYGPTALTLIEQYGPQLWGAVAPLVEKSAAQGTLQQDVGSLVSTVKTLAPMMGPIQTVGHVADFIGSIQPADAGNPTPEQDRLARERGGH